MTDSSPSDRDVSETDRYDVLRYGDDSNRAVPAGDGQRVIEAHETEVHRRRLIATLTVSAVSTAVVVIAGVSLLEGLVGPLVAGLVVGVACGIARFRYWDHGDFVPEVVATDASPRVVREYVDEFDADEVTRPFD